MESRFGTVLSVALLGQLGCEAQTTVKTRFVVPSSFVPTEANRARLHVALRSAGSFSQKLQVDDGRCPAFEPSVPEEKEAVHVRDGEFVLEQSRIPSVPEFCVSAWLDMNESGQIDAGDAIGRLDAPFPVQPSTFFGSNVYDSPPVVLAPVK